MYFIEVQLIYNVVLISAGQHSDSVSYMYTHSSSHSLPFQFISGCRVQLPAYSKALITDSSTTSLCLSRAWELCLGSLAALLCLLGLVVQNHLLNG